MKVYVVGYKGAGFGGGLIKWFTFGGFSHVSLVFEGTAEELEIEPVSPSNLPVRVEIDAIQGRGVTRRLFGAITGKRDVFAVDCSSGVAMKIYKTACALVGCGYDWAGIYGFLRRKKRENPYKWFCSELVAHCLKKHNIVLLNLPPWKQSPVMICASTVLKKTLLKNAF